MEHSAVPRVSGIRPSLSNRDPCPRREILNRGRFRVEGFRCSNSRNCRLNAHCECFLRARHRHHSVRMLGLRHPDERAAPPLHCPRIRHLYNRGRRIPPWGQEFQSRYRPALRARSIDTNCQLVLVSYRNRFSAACTTIIAWEKRLR
jgi:hypothetical protein